MSALLLEMLLRLERAGNSALPRTAPPLPATPRHAPPRIHWLALDAGHAGKGRGRDARPGTEHLHHGCRRRQCRLHTERAARGVLPTQQAPHRADSTARGPAHLISAAYSRVLTSDIIQ